jgi:hypothetical protein
MKSYVKGEVWETVGETCLTFHSKCIPSQLPVRSGASLRTGRETSTGKLSWGKCPHNRFQPVERLALSGKTVSLSPIYIRVSETVVRAPGGRKLKGLLRGEFNTWKRAGNVRVVTGTGNRKLGPLGREGVCKTLSSHFTSSGQFHKILMCLFTRCFYSFQLYGFEFFYYK